LSEAKIPFSSGASAFCVVAHTYNPRYLRVGDQEDDNSRRGQGKQRDPISIAIVTAISRQVFDQTTGYHSTGKLIKKKSAITHTCNVTAPTRALGEQGMEIVSYTITVF
jgi:hypothetical protein